MASAGARAYNGGLGTEPPAGSSGRANGQGIRGGEAPPPEAEKFLVFDPKGEPLFSHFSWISW